MAPTAEAVAAIRFIAEADIHGKVIRHEIAGLKTLELLQDPKIRVVLITDEQRTAGNFEQTPEITVHAGQTTRAWLRVERIAHDGIVEFGKEDSGRNLPHGVFVDNIGLNGLMLLAGQTERAAQLRLGQDGFEVSTVSEIRSEAYAPDAVVAQDPAGDTPGSRVANPYTTPTRRSRS